METIIQCGSERSRQVRLTGAQGSRFFHKLVTSLCEAGKTVIHWQASLIKAALQHDNAINKGVEKLYLTQV